MNFQEKLASLCDRNEVCKGLLSKDASALLESMTSEFIAFNAHTNLSAIRDEDGILFRHIVDCLPIVKEIPNGARTIDVGCGGGFPSLVIAIANPHVQVVACDSVTKKVEYVRACAETLGLSNVQTTNERAEDLGQKNGRAQYDFAVCRAFSSLPTIIELLAPLCKVGGKILAMKSQTTTEEIAQSQNALSELCCSLQKVVRYELTNGQETLTRTIVCIQKDKETPAKYPRNFAKISKNPL